MTTRDNLQAAASALCADFAANADIDTLLAHFSTTHQISAREHGLPLLAPFLGRTFTGRSAGPASVQAYFALLQQHIAFENMSFGEARRLSKAFFPSCRSAGVSPFLQCVISRFTQVSGS